MKKLLIAVALLIGTTTYAHEVTKKCWLNGRYQLAAAHTSVGATCRIRLISNTGTFDSTFTITQPDFLFTVPQPNKAIAVRVEVVISGYSIKLWTDNVQCTTLPLKFGEMSIKELSGNTIRVYISIFDMENVNRIELELKRPNSEGFKTVGIIFPKDVKENETYYLDVKL